MTLLATLLAGAVAAADAPLDRVDLGRNTVLVGHVIACSPAGVRFVPVAGSEMLLPVSAVKSVARADGQRCEVSAPPEKRSLVPGIIAMVALPLAGAVAGTAIGHQVCWDREDQTPCEMGGALVGLASGLVIGSVILVGSASPSQPARPVAARSGTGVFLAMRF